MQNIISTINDDGTYGLYVAEDFVKLVQDRLDQNGIEWRRTDVRMGYTDYNSGQSADFGQFQLVSEVGADRFLEIVRILRK
ncbi:hypothetical protein Pla175_11230 [Pirellulimonas nuda]|uniref:Uncharacterized protein n=1 Tax=Pirellulimonas nuda TaxID=2528009 RepID=A0A518D8F2_9BACT|nr:hypothetical protein [Pirellulimonas nuda]QDU87757.1 hypothetical protein Pla175_11230 [Pirellulimonas nuda]